MKNLLLIMLLVLGINAIAQQNNQQGFIQLHLYTNDNTKVTIECVDDAITYSDTVTQFTLVLHPNKEYYITFSKDGYTSKEIFVSTNSVNIYNRYNIKLDAHLDKGESNVKQLYGALLYNKKQDTFVKQKYGN